ncbi:type I-F CRISPR-associated protein Csy2 [Azotobacter chroococcum]
MNACPRFDHLLVLPRLRVQNANAVSSPLTHGFPSITAFLGLMWALERKARAAGLDLAFKAVGTVCHDHQEQVTEGGFVKAFRLTRNPVGKDGSTAAIVEEGRIHLELSLAFAIRSERWNREPEARDADIATVAELLAGMRIAGGTLLPRRNRDGFAIVPGPST